MTINAVFINFGGIGDEILFLPTIKSFKQKYPNSIVTLVLEPRAKCIKDLSNLVDNALECDIKGRCRFLEIIKLIFSLWCGQFDMIFSSGASPLISVILFLSGIKKRYGYDTGLLSRILLSEAISLNKNQYAAEMYHDLVSSICDESAELPCIRLQTSPQTNPLDEKVVLPGGRKTILIHPGSSKLSKRKNIIKSYDAWNELITVLKDSYNVILAGGPDDDEVISQIDKVGLLNLYGKTKNIVELARLIKKADLLVCVDSAPMHLAVALNKPLVAIFGPTDEKKLLPESDKFVAITTHMSCRPCLWDRRESTCEHRNCLKIPVQNVALAISQIAEMSTDGVC